MKIEFTNGLRQNEIIPRPNRNLLQLKWKNPRSHVLGFIFPHSSTFRYSKNQQDNNIDNLNPKKLNSQK